MDIFKEVTDRIISELEKGSVPWEKPWTGTRSGAYSRSTGKPYSLLNQMLLGMPGEYITFNQCSQAGGFVRKGEKARFVVFWKFIEEEKVNEKGEMEKASVPFLRYYNVFHIDQCEGIESKYKPEALKHVDPVADAEDIMAAYLQRSGCGLFHSRQDQAFYRPLTDSIHLPLRDQFKSSSEYYGTLFHEAAHSTGHKSRLNRIDNVASFGSEVYSKEELVAEISAAASLHELGIETPKTFRNNAAYIQSWLMALRNDKRLIVSAAGKAEKAVNLIFGRSEAAPEV